MSSRDVHRFRLTVEVDTPDGLRSGSSVVEVERRKHAAWLPTPGPRHEYRVRGEAVFVTSAPGATSSPSWPTATTSSGWTKSSRSGSRRTASTDDQDVWSGRTALRGVVELEPPLVPTLVTFADPLDPATVRVVRPGEFEEVFGPGFRFRRATLEVVPRSMPVTSSVIERHLPWLAGMTTNLAGTRGRSTNDLREWLPPRRFKRPDP